MLVGCFSLYYAYVLAISMFAGFRHMKAGSGFDRAQQSQQCGCELYFLDMFPKPEQLEIFDRYIQTRCTGLILALSNAFSWILTPRPVLRPRCPLRPACITGRPQVRPREAQACQAPDRPRAGPPPRRAGGFRPLHRVHLLPPRPGKSRMRIYTWKYWYRPFYADWFRIGNFLWVSFFSGSSALVDFAASRRMCVADE